MPLRVLLTLLLALSFTPAFSPTREIPLEIGSHDFFRLFSELSEPGGYFDTDNLVSNERAYLKILPDLQRECASGGAYFGVGPDQNYSYIAHLNPRVAFIIDIRRLNALQHLYFKALFQLSASRVDYLERLFGKHIRKPGKAMGGGISELLREIDESVPDKLFADEKLAEALGVIRSWNAALSSDDYRSIQFIASEFIEHGPELKFTSFNRPPRAHHPTYRQLLEETDSQGGQANYLAREEYFLVIKKMHRENRIIPIVGDLAGADALRRAGEELRRRNLVISCFYVSNVEFYLFGTARWDPYVQNLRNLPRAEKSFLIRSYANFPQFDPPRRTGYYMGTATQSVREFLANEASGAHRTYWDLIARSLTR